MTYRAACIPGGAVALLLVTIANAGAATIQLTVTTRVSALPDGISVEIELRNDGDAPAVDLLPAVSFRGREALGTFVPVLEPASRTIQTVQMTEPGLSAHRGAWPVVVRVPYADSARHPFEALHVAVATVGAPAAAPEVRLRLSGARLATAGRTVVDVEGSAGTEVAVTLLTARGVTIAPRQTLVALDDQGRHRINAQVTSSGATPDSRLPVFAIAQYDAGAGPEAIVAQSTVEIVAAEGGGSRWVLAGLLVLIVLWIVMVFRRPPATARADWRGRGGTDRV